MTERITLGTAALLPAIREPLLAAQAIATLDQLCSGRLVLGLGAGFPERSRPEFALTGAPYDTRYARLADTVRLWRALWSDRPPASFRGSTLHLDQLPELPGPHQPGGPPLWLASASPGALRRTGRDYDGWLPYLPSAADYATGLNRVQEAAAAAGRDPAAIVPGLFATVLMENDAGRARRILERYCQAFYRAPLELVSSIQLIVGGPPDQVVARLRAYLEAGARHVVLRVGALDRGEHLERIAETLLPLQSDQVTRRGGGRGR